MRIRIVTLAAAVVVAALVPSPALAAGDPYGDDTHRIVPFRNTVQQTYTSGIDTWEVWLCDVAGWDSYVDLDATVDELNLVLNGYFSWLSQGMYATSFTVGGYVASSDVITQDQIETLDAPYAPDCESEVAEASTSSPNGVLIIVDIPFPEAYATVGAICPEDPFTGCQTRYPANARRAVVGAATVKTVSPADEPFWNTIAHEIGHTLSWPHSYSGLTYDPSTNTVSEYDNPMDVMSGGFHSGTPVATIAYNRYAAGWIQPAGVGIHADGTAQYKLAAIGGTGLGMLVIPGVEEGHFFTLGVRRRAAFDNSLLTAGVEVYEIDQRRGIACEIPDSWPGTWPCFGTLTRVRQSPAVFGMLGTDHVLGIDDEATIAGFTVKVVAAGLDSFTVDLTPVSSGTFLDDDRNIHEENIEAIAAAGITNGCNPPDNDRFCPGEVVSRAEMAAFIVRALGFEGQLVPYQGTFGDVPEDAWYARYVDTLAALGITDGYGDGTYRPDASVTRAEVAVFLTRAFATDAIPSAVGVFADVPPDGWYADEAEWIFSGGITKGCRSEPLSFCPDDPVKRDQMASFIARALGIGT